MKKTKECIRTCVVCKTKHDKHKLLRYIRNKANNELAADISYKACGRGIYVCRDECVQKLEKSIVRQKHKQI